MPCKLLSLLVFLGLSQLITNTIPSHRIVVYPKFYSSIARSRRDIKLNVFYDHESKVETLDLGHVKINLVQNENLVFARDFRVQLVKDGGLNSTNFLGKASCNYLRSVTSGSEFYSVISVCGSGISGLVSTKDELYFIEPLDLLNNSHVLSPYKAEFGLSLRKKRNIGVVCGTTEFETVVDNVRSYF